MDFSVRTVRLYNYLCEEMREYVMSKQLLRSGTSIGANAHEAHNAQSDREFIAKMYIALKEATETEFWIELLIRTDYLSMQQGDSIQGDCVELKKILTTIIKSAKARMQKGPQ